jgi:hypothetical protein
MSMKPLSKKELKEYFQVYREAFPDWDVKHQVMLTRSAGPISQHIPFQSLSYGAYRPECMVDVVGPPDGGATLLHQMLDVKHRQVERRQHSTEWPKVLKAIEEQFVPDVRRPLEVAEVLRLAEEEALRDGISNERYLNGLATLNVHLGHDDRAVEWRDRAEASFKEFAEATPPPEWMLKQVEFARQLRDAIREGRGSEFLAETGDQPTG